MLPNVWSCTSQDLVVPFWSAIAWGILLLKQLLLINTLGLCCPPILNGAPMLMRSPARLNVYLDLFGGLLALMILPPWRNCLLLLLDQSLSIVLLFGLQTRKVTNISWKGFRGVSLAIVFPVLGTQDLLMIPGSRFLIFPPPFPALIIFVPCLLSGVYGASMTSVGRITSR